MRQEQYPLGRLRAKAREEVSQMQHLAVTQAMVDLLHDHRIRPRPQLGEKPVGFLLMPGFIGDPRAERHLPLDVGERGPSIEFDGRLAAAVSGARLTRERENHSHARRTPHAARGHRICPTLVDSCTNAVITNCEILRLVCRSSFST